jgi:L-alanine-DL-glutamate epimerase-like enolase superfamily enzyme
MDVQIEQRAFRLREPLHTAYGALRERTILELTLTGADGLVGRGEAAPLEPYDGVPLEQVAAALARYRPVLEAADTMTGIEVLDGCRAVSDEPYALAAVDIALWDRAGRRAGRPIADLLVDVPAVAVPVNFTIGATDRAGAADAALRAARAGFTCVKVKVGVGDDAGRVAAVRAAAGAEMSLRLDANGAWTVEEAIAAIGALAPAGLELVEEPVHGLHELAQVRRAVPVRVSMDESAAIPGALASGAADAVCLKIGRCGGIAGLLAAAELVRAVGGEPYVASALDGPIGIAAAVHAAAALAPLPPCGLATLALFEDVDEGPLAVSRGEIPVPDAPGLGLG